MFLMMKGKISKIVGKTHKISQGFLVQRYNVKVLMYYNIHF